MNNSLDKIINDYKTNNLNFSDNSQILNYININTNNEIKLRLKENLESILNSFEHNRQLDYLSNLFKLEDKTFNGIVSYLEKEINYVKPIGLIYESEYFNVDYKTTEMNKITQRIRRFTEVVKEPTSKNKL